MACSTHSTERMQMALARLTTDPGREYEVVNLTDDAEWVLRDAANDVRVFEVSSTREMVEIKCPRCGRWGTDFISVGELEWLCVECEARGLGI